MDLSLRVDEDSTEEEDEAADGEDKSGYELDIIFHKVKICKKDISQRVDTPKKIQAKNADCLKSSANMPTILSFLQENPQLFGIWSGIFCDLVI